MPDDINTADDAITIGLQLEIPEDSSDVSFNVRARTRFLGQDRVATLRDRVGFIIVSPSLDIETTASTRYVLFLCV